MSRFRDCHRSFASVALAEERSPCKGEVAGSNPGLGHHNVIEIDGSQHQSFEECKERDKRKDKFLNSEGYEVLRIVWSDMCKDTKDKIKEAYDFIHK